MNGAPWKDWEVDQAKLMRADGESYYSIGRFLGRPDDSVRGMLKREAPELAKPLNMSAATAAATRASHEKSQGWPRVPDDPVDGYDKHFDAIMRETGNKGLQVCTLKGRVWGMTGRPA